MRVSEGIRAAGAKSARFAARGRDNGQFWGRVDERPKLVVSGTTLTAAAGPAATTLTVDDAADFNGDGGYLRLRLSELGDPDAAPLVDLVVAYTGWDGDYDDVPDDTISLAEPLPTPLVGASVGCPVDVWDPARDAPAQEWVMGVVPDDSDDDGASSNTSAGTGRSLPVTVDPADVDALPLGTFPGLGESVLVGPDSETGDEDDLVLIRVKGAKHVRDGSFSPEVLAAAAEAHSAEQRSTGQKAADILTSLFGARVHFDTDAFGRGRGRWFADDDTVIGTIRGIVDELTGRYLFGISGGDQSNPSRLRLWTYVLDNVIRRRIDLICDEIVASGLLQATNGITVQQSSTVMEGWDWATVTKGTNTEGQATYVHFLSGGGTVIPAVRNLPNVKATVMNINGTDLTVQFNRMSDGTPVTNQSVTVDFIILSGDRNAA